MSFDFDDFPLTQDSRPCIAHTTRACGRPKESLREDVAMSGIGILVQEKAEDEKSARLQGVKMVKFEASSRDDALELRMNTSARVPGCHGEASPLSRLQRPQKHLATRLEAQGKSTGEAQF